MNENGWGGKCPLGFGQPKLLNCIVCPVLVSMGQLHAALIAVINRFHNINPVS